jgi:hypothetical protein
MLRFNVRAVWAEKPAIDVVLKPSSLLQNNLDGVNRVGIRVQLPDVTPFHGRLLVAVTALVDKRISEDVHGTEGEKLRRRNRLFRYDI